MRLLIITLLLVGAQMGTNAQYPRNPGNWTFHANYHTEWTRIGINTKHQVFDSTGFTIQCDTAKKVILFIQEDGDTTDIHYELLETYMDDPYTYKRGVFYYKTAGLGDVEFWPGEMVRRNWPGEFEIMYSIQVKRRKP